MSFYANPDPMFQPAMRLINTISQTDPAVIETTFAHDYVSGIILRFYIPFYYGMWQLDSIMMPITVLTATTFSIALDSTAYDTFLAPIEPPYKRETACCVPVGNLNSLYSAAVRNVR